jgi:hypothetical protein
MSENEKPRGKSGTCARCIDLERHLAEAQKELKAARHVLEMDDPRLLKCVQTIDRVLRERNEAQGKLDAVERVGADYFRMGIGDVAFELRNAIYARILKGE